MVEEPPRPECEWRRRRGGRRRRVSGGRGAVEGGNDGETWGDGWGRVGPRRGVH